MIRLFIGAATVFLFFSQTEQVAAEGIENPFTHNTPIWENLQSCLVFEEIAWGRATQGWENELRFVCQHALQAQERGVESDTLQATLAWLLDLHNNAITRMNTGIYGSDVPPLLEILDNVPMPRYLYRNSWFNSTMQTDQWRFDNDIDDLLPILRDVDFFR